LVDIGSKSERIDDIMRTGYAGHLVTQTGDPGKEEIAFAQSYFALLFPSAYHNGPCLRRIVNAYSVVHENRVVVRSGMLRLHLQNTHSIYERRNVIFQLLPNAHPYLGRRVLWRHQS